MSRFPFGRASTTRTENRELMESEFWTCPPPLKSVLEEAFIPGNIPPLVMNFMFSGLKRNWLMLASMLDSFWVFLVWFLVAELFS